MKEECMKIKVELVFEYGSEKEAQAVAKAVEVDNYQFVKTKVDGMKIISCVESESIPSMIHTLDDFLACIGIAERVVKGEKE
jgi:tRNA threonylcarbamoyladenosine modification (KEOPS) complex  Pcc1 subunit